MTFGCFSHSPDLFYYNSHPPTASLVLRTAIQATIFGHKFGKRPAFLIPPCDPLHNLRPFGPGFCINFGIRLGAAITPLVYSCGRGSS